MTIQSPLTPPLVAGEDESKWSLLRRLILAIAAERQKKADEAAKECPPRSKISPLKRFQGVEDHARHR
jgi:hypothetical protein